MLSMHDYIELKTTLIGIFISIILLYLATLSNSFLHKDNNSVRKQKALSFALVTLI